MFKQLIINDFEHETRVALVEDGTIAELFIERHDESDIAGNIYKGKVRRVLPGMQAAFVDIGLQQAAFIYVNDLIFGTAKEYERIFLNDNEKDEKTQNVQQVNFDAVSTFKNGFQIEDVITEGQEIMVQVAKAPIGTKGARVTGYISIPGRFLVLLPNAEHIGVSRRIEEETERKRLRKLIQEIKSDGFGYIVRTAAEGVEKEKLVSEMAFLNNIWNNIVKKYQTVASTSLIHRELTVSLRAVRDLLTHEVEKLIIDSKSGYETIISFLDNFMPGMKSAVEYYDGVEPIFDAYNLEGDISRALKRKVWLKSGGYIVIEQTEALSAIDVNTGRFVGKHNLEETILKTNLEAVKEIAYQIRLRDLGGIIIIDFIDMEKKLNQEKVYKALYDASKKDRSKTYILPMSELGLIQMTRKRIKKPLNRLLCEPCFYCDGEGYLISKKTICYNIYREILRDADDMVGAQCTLRVNAEIADLLLGEENRIIVNLEKKIKKQIIIFPSKQFHMEQFDFFESLNE
ncbi:MAG: Rne/Rng family ribonuclease [Desulfobacterales bacterium]